MDITRIRPKKRSKLRSYFGKKFYLNKRYLTWLLDSQHYTKEYQEESLPFQIFTHQTPLYRQLKDVDMWYQQNKVKNLKIAIKKLNRIVIQPGQTFSYWKLIGNPTKRKGYVDGMILYYGKYKSGIGGGLCQLSNLIYWMSLHTALTVTERHRHSYDVFPDSNRTQPFGSGATCAYNYMDLQIKNETEYPYQLGLELTEQHLVGEWKSTVPGLHSYSIYQKDHEITPAYWGGYVRQNSIFRKVYNKNGQLIDDQYVTENKAIMMYDPLLEYQDVQS